LIALLILWTSTGSLDSTIRDARSDNSAPVNGRGLAGRKTNRMTSNCSSGGRILISSITLDAVIAIHFTICMMPHQPKKTVRRLHYTMDFGCRSNTPILHKSNAPLPLLAGETPALPGAKTFNRNVCGDMVYCSLY